VTAPTPVPPFRDQLAPLTLIARCTNVSEPDGRDCPGLLRYLWGQIEAACDTCGARCGIAVALWIDVQPSSEAEARVQAAANQRAAEELDAMAVAFYADARHLVSTGEEAYRHAAEDCRARAAALAQPAPEARP
jgi:hypothetical protein